MKRDCQYLIGNKFALGNAPNKTSFKKGSIPWNKELKGIHLSPKSEYKKGHVCPSRKNIGTITQRIDKGKNIRNWIKIKQPNTWIGYTRYVWQQSYGEIPKKAVIHHVDKDTLNDKIQNLCILNRAEHLRVHKDELLFGKKEPMRFNPSQNQ